MEGNQEEQIADRMIPVQLIINGLVFVDLNKQDDEVLTATTRNAGGAKQQRTAVNDNVTPLSTFHDSFDHSMLLFFTFWGVDSLQKILEEDGGFQNPVIDSVSIGKKKLLTFGIDKDDNYLYKGDHNYSMQKHLLLNGIS